MRKSVGATATARAIYKNGTAIPPEDRKRPSKSIDYVGSRVLSDCVKIALAGDPNRLLDRSVPVHRLAAKIADELSGDDEPAWKMHRLLELVWDRLEGKVAEKLEIDAQVRGVIALPVVTSSTLDWSADAIKVLATTHEAPALPSSDQDT